MEKGDPADETQSRKNNMVSCSELSGTRREGKLPSFFLSDVHSGHLKFNRDFLAPLEPVNVADFLSLPRDPMGHDDFEVRYHCDSNRFLFALYYDFQDLAT